MNEMNFFNEKEVGVEMVVVVEEELHLLEKKIFT